jgi:hypothetical protein
MKFDFNELLASIKEAQQMQGVNVCECKCAEAKVKPKSQRYFDILHVPSGDYVAYDVPESKLSDCIQQLLADGLVVKDLTITQEILLKQVWMVDE